MRAVNLIRDERPAVGAGGRSQGTAAMVLGLIGVLAILAGLYGVARHEASSSRAEVAALEADTRLVQQRASQLSSYTSFAQLRNERVQDVSELVQTRFDWASALRELGRVLPPGASISSLNGSIAAVAPVVSETPTETPTETTGSAEAVAPSVTSATPAGSTPTFAITGCAANQAQVAATLYRLRLIAGSEVQLQSSVRSVGTAGESQCGGEAASFTATVSFDPLPSESALAASSASTVVPSADSSGSSSLHHSEAAVVIRAKEALAGPGAASGGTP